MANDMEALARALLGSVQGQAAGETLGRLAAFMRTPDGQKLTTLLSGSGTIYIRRAAQAAVAGDEAWARAALSQALATRDGAALAAPQEKGAG